MARSTPTRTVLVLLALAACRCSDDGTASASGGGSTGSGADDGGGPAGPDGDGDDGDDDGAQTGPGGGTTMSADDGADDDPPGDDTGSDADSGDTGDPPRRPVCPRGPFADDPLPDGNVTAEAVPNTSVDLYPGGLAEGPLWLDGAVWLSHFGPGSTPPAAILRIVPGGAVEVAIPDSGTNGLAVDGDGMIVGAAHDEGELARFDPATGARTPIVSEYEGNRFNSPNDIAIRSDGNIYFTDPSWQAPQPNPQPTTGVYRVDPAGVPTLVDPDPNQPNGIALSPDETTLYVTSQGGMFTYAVAGDGAVAGPGQPFGSGLSGLDGMTVDCAGNLYVTVHGEGQVRVLDPGGNELGRIDVAPQVTNAAFGGADGQTLYVTAGDPNAGNALYSVDLPIPGYPY